MGPALALPTLPEFFDVTSQQFVLNAGLVHIKTYGDPVQVAPAVPNQPCPSSTNSPGKPLQQALILAMQVLAHIRGYGDAAQEPQQFPTSPALAVPVALAKAQMQQSEVDYWEINQAFSVVDLVNQQLLGLDPSR